jgi:hypothetical protein
MLDPDIQKGQSDAKCISFNILVLPMLVLGPKIEPRCTKQNHSVSNLRPAIKCRTEPIIWPLSVPDAGTHHAPRRRDTFIH